MYIQSLFFWWSPTLLYLTYIKKTLDYWQILWLRPYQVTEFWVKESPLYNSVFAIQCWYFISLYEAKYHTNKSSIGNRILKCNDWTCFYLHLCRYRDRDQILVTKNLVIHTYTAFVWEFLRIFKDTEWLCCMQKYITIYICKIMKNSHYFFWISHCRWKFLKISDNFFEILDSNTSPLICF